VPVFARSVQAAGLRAPSCVIATNATGAGSRNAAALTAALSAQLKQTVQWGACMETIAERRPAFVLEIGGGQALARMWAARYPAIPVRSLDAFREVEGAAAWGSSLL
jgi:[acyl-carrier-protein] S-malonyltransferase